MGLNEKKLPFEEGLKQLKELLESVKEGEVLDKECKKKIEECLHNLKKHCDECKENCKKQETKLQDHH